MDSRTAKNYLDHLDTKLETYREKAADVLSRNSTFSRFGSLNLCYS